MKRAATEVLQGQLYVGQEVYGYQEAHCYVARLFTNSLTYTKLETVLLPLPFPSCMYVNK